LKRAFGTVERITGVDTPGQLTAYLVALGHGGTHWVMGTVYILVPFVRQDLGLSYAEVGAVYTAMAMAAFAINIGSGVIVDLTGRRVLLLGLGLGFCAMALMVIGLVPSLLGLTLGVMIIGGANNLWHPAAFSFLAGRFPNNRGFALSVHGVGANIGDALGPLAAGGLMVWFGWQGAAIANALPMFGFAVIIVLIMWRGERRDRTEAPPSVNLRTYFQGMIRMVKQRAVLGVCLLAGCRTMTQNGIYVFLPLYLTDVIGIEAVVLGFVMATMQTGGMVSGPIAGTWSDRIGRRPIVLAGLAATVLVVVMLTLIRDEILLVATVGLLGFALFAVRPVVHSWMMDLTPPGMSGGATSLVFGAQSAMRMVIPILGGFVADTWGLIHVFHLVVAIAVLGIITAALVPVQKTAAAAP